MRIYLVNNVKKTKITTAHAAAVVRAINRQLREHVEPYWSIKAEVTHWPWKETSLLKATEDHHDRAIVYLQEQPNIEGAIGYHNRTNKGLPYGFVFTDVADELGEPWTVTLSHEVLEILGDPFVNLLAGGPHPNPQERRDVGHWLELCDAVQAQSYQIDGVDVSNFVLPLYFTVEDEGKPVDYLNTGLKSFGVNPGGYVGFYDPKRGEHDTYFAKTDKTASRRLKIKSALGKLRRSTRYTSTLSR